MTAGEMTAEVSKSNMGRLRWLVLREFSTLPCSRAARRMTDRDCLRYAAHMVLDMGGVGGESTGEQNPAFDEARFERLKGGAA